MSTCPQWQGDLSYFFQFERARVIYKYALEHLDKQLAGELFKAYTIFEKKFGNRSGIENVIVSKRKFQYEEEVKVINSSFSTVILKRSIR